MTKNEQNRLLVIEPNASLLAVDFGELWRYRDLFLMLVKRDIVIWYKQTVFGPLWFFIQPILTSVSESIVQPLIVLHRCS